MSIPRIKTLARITDEPEDLRKILDGTYSLDDLRERFARLDAWVRACYHEPGEDEQRLNAADEFLGTCGIEGGCNEDGSSGWSYCNTGDMYADTLILNRHGDFRVGQQEHADR